MNRKLLALAVGTALALPVAAQAAPTIYGKLDVSVENIDGEQFDFIVPPTGITQVDNVTTMETNASRFGLRGEEKLNSALNVIYQVEYGVTVDGDSANSPDLSARDRFLGLKSDSLGTLKLGRMNTPLKDAEGAVDVFNDSRLDMENVFAGQNRVSNSIAYISPKLADAITARVTLITQEQASGGGLSASVAYEGSGLYLALAYDDNVDGQADGGALNGGNSAYGTYFFGPTPVNPNLDLEMDTMRAVASWEGSGLKIGALLQKSEGSGSGTQPEQTGFLLSGAYTMGDLTFKLEYASSEGEFGSFDLGTITQMAAGVDYALSQTTKVYGMLGNYQYEAPKDVFTSLGDADMNLIGIGMAHSF